jgi:hypothetical protein
VGLDQPAMELGTSNDEVFCDLLNLSGDALAALRAEGVV